jgi:hypothetical protein
MFIMSLAEKQQANEQSKQKEVKMAVESVSLKYIPLETFGAENLSVSLEKDIPSSIYQDEKRDVLAKKILASVGPQNNTDSKMNGYVIQEADSLWGLVLFTKSEKDETSIADMYCFEQGRAKNLFKYISHFMRQEHGWQGSFVFDDNNLHLKNNFYHAAGKPKTHTYIKV